MTPAAPYPTNPRAVWTPEDVAALVLTRADHDWRAITAVAVILAESGGNPHATRVVIHDDPTHVAHLTIDRGLMQFNSYWWGHVPNRLAYDPVTAWGVAFNYVARDGRGSWRHDWEQWNAYTNGSHRDHIVTAYRAVNAIGDVRGLEAL